MKRGLLIATGLLAVIVIGFAAVLLLRSGASPVGSASPSATPSPTPIPIDQALLNRRVTLLLLGTDQNAIRRERGESVLTDSMIVLSVNAAHTHAVMISVPRDTVDIPLPGGTIWPQKLNALYEARGVTTVRDTFARLLGAKIDYTIVVDMDDFAAIVDAFGGVDIVATEAIDDPSVSLKITLGRHHLDGRTALAYSRSRHTTNDFSRAARQQQVLRALLERFNQPGAKVDVPKLLASLAHLKTDIPADKLPTILEIGRRSRAAAVTDEVVQPPQFYRVELSGQRGYVLLPRLEAIRAFALSLLTGP